MPAMADSVAYAPNCIRPSFSILMLSLFFGGASGWDRLRANPAHGGACSGREYRTMNMRTCSGAHTRVPLAPPCKTDGYSFLAYLPSYHSCGIESLRGWETSHISVPYPRGRPFQNHSTIIAALRMRGGGAAASPRKTTGTLSAAGAREGAGVASKKPRNKKLPQRSREKVCLYTCVPDIWIYEMPYVRRGMTCEV